MVLTKKFKAFDDAILDLHPELKEVLKPNDHYPELEILLKKKICKSTFWVLKYEGNYQ